jgi:hypothetical protein
MNYGFTMNHRFKLTWPHDVKGIVIQCSAMGTDDLK